MVVSSRTMFLALGLGLAGLAPLAAPALGQQPDAAVRKAATQAAAKAPELATFATIDMSAVFKSYDKVKASSEEFKAQVMAKQGELMKLQSEAQSEAEQLAKMTPGSLDFKKHEDRITQLKAQHEALREQYQRDFTSREAEMFATIYKEVQAMVTRVAVFRKFNYVLRVSNEPINSANPNAAMMAVERVVVYSDNKADITNDVIAYLNAEYKAAGGKVPSPATSTSAAPGGPGMKPSGN